MFSKTPASPKPVSSRTMGSSTFSVLGADTAIKGDVSASADLHVDGRIEGDVTCNSLVQGETSEIVGAVKAETARLSGTIRGTIDVRDLVVLKSARIHGDVHYDALTIEQGAHVDGRFAPRVTGPVAVGSSDDSEARLTLAS
jgi:cytoskeletal protein CcmA (bactofilin family)